MNFGNKRTFLEKSLKESFNRNDMAHIKQNLVYYEYKTLQSQIDPKYKKELCNNFITTGNCKYNLKCRFAHGINDVIKKSSTDITVVEERANKEINNELLEILKLRKNYSRLPIFIQITSQENKSTNDNSLNYSSQSNSERSNTDNDDSNTKRKSKLSLLMDSVTK